MTPFSNTARILHWSVAGLIVGQYVLAKLAEKAEHHDKTLEQLALLANHKSVGITILVLAVIRLAYRLISKTPDLPESMPRWQKLASKASHVLLYYFLFALPLTGWLMSSAKAYSVSWFNLFALPDLVSPNESIADIMHSGHHFLSKALVVIAAVHILAALKHHFIDKDEVLKRMAGIKSWLLFAVVITIIIGAFGRGLNSSTAPKQVTDRITKNVVVLSNSNLPEWEVDYDQSYIKFTGDQAGAPFEGTWQKWTAIIQFDATQLEQSRFNVSIDPSSGFSNDQDRDDTIRSTDFFDIVQFPEAHYQAQNFSASGNNFISKGALSMKGLANDVELTFSVSSKGNKRVLIGSAPLDRLIWNIGTGDWSDTTWVGQTIMVEVYVSAIVKNNQP